MVKADSWTDYMKNCRICPRECGVDRTAGKRGLCGADSQVILARAALHHWEEPCISGSRGSGAVFFSGCSLGCIYCQNAAISGIGRRVRSECPSAPSEGSGSAERGSEAIEGRRSTAGTPGLAEDRRSIAGTPGLAEGRRSTAVDLGLEEGQRLPGIEVSIERLAQIFLNLQNQENANNINLVTAAHFIPQVARALMTAKEQGLEIPVIYNSGGYEKVSSLRMLDGLIDVYLPDFKYFSPETAKQYSHAEDYPERAKAAIAEMVRQTGPPLFYQEKENTDMNERPGDNAQGKQKTSSRELIRRGVIVRHLLLPGHVSEAKAIVSYLHQTYGSEIILSLMNQYTPMPEMKEDSLLGRKTTRREYSRLIDHALEIGVEYGFIQEGETAKESFIPAWNGEGVR